MISILILNGKGAVGSLVLALPISLVSVVVQFLVGRGVVNKAVACPSPVVDRRGWGECLVHPGGVGQG